MEKQIEFNGFNKAVIKKLYDNDSVLCDLVEEATDTTEKETIEVCIESNISFDKGNYPFILTNDDILELRPSRFEEPII